MAGSDDDIPSWLIQDETNNQIKIITSDREDSGIYSFELTASAQGITVDQNF